VRAFLVGESLTVGVGGILLGALAGAALAWMLVQVLTGVFDPPPSAPAVPWGYLALTLALTAAALLAATTGAGWLARRPPLDILGRP
jgi:putative ABC transport system permease protein